MHSEKWMNLFILRARHQGTWKGMGPVRWKSNHSIIVYSIIASSVITRLTATWLLVSEYEWQAHIYVNVQLTHYTVKAQKETWEKRTWSQDNTFIKNINKNVSFKSVAVLLIGWTCTSNNTAEHRIDLMRLYCSSYIDQYKGTHNCARCLITVVLYKSDLYFILFF